MRLDDARGLAMMSVVAAGISAALAVGAAFASAWSNNVRSVQLSWVAAMSAVIGGILGFESFQLSSRRHLGAPRRAALEADLRRLAPLPLSVRVVADDAEATGYAEEILQAFHRAGWPADGVIVDASPGSAPNSDVFVAVKDPDEPPDGYGNLLWTLKRVGIRAIRADSPSIPDKSSVAIFVGHRV